MSDARVERILLLLEEILAVLKQLDENQRAMNRMKSVQLHHEGVLKDKEAEWR